MTEKLGLTPELFSTSAGCRNSGRFSLIYAKRGNTDLPTS